MTFSDIFKSSFLENVTAVSLVDMLIALVLAFLLGLFIFFVYKKTYRGVMYSASFGVTLIALTMISTIVILAVSSNIVLSLGMVGALSIVRFRAAIKEPLDIAYLFWAIAVGIVLAAGMIPLAVIGSILIGIVLIVYVNRKQSGTPYIAVIQYSDQRAEANVSAYLEASTSRSAVQAKSIQNGLIEVNYDVRLKDDNTDFINKISTMVGVQSAVLVSYNGEYMR